jgi:hypothetical protein
MCFAKASKLGHGNGDCLDNYGFHAPIDGNHFVFQRMDYKVKDRLVLSVDRRWRHT